MGIVELEKGQQETAEIMKYADMIQIGTGNDQYFELFEAVSKIMKLVILKKGFGNEAGEWFSYTDYIANQTILVYEKNTNPFIRDMEVYFRER